MKKTILPILTLAASLVCGSACAAVEGDIWQLLPCDRYGQEVDRPSLNSYNDLPAGTNIYFKVRLVSKGNDYTPYHIAGTGANSTNALIDPPRICLYVSGQPTFADYIGEIEYGSHFTDVIFRYTTKAGDFAMPLKLGTKDGPASDKHQNEPRYFFDPLTSGMWEWVSTNKTMKTEKAVANWWFFNGDPATRDETGRTKGMDTSLAECHYYIKTVDFDPERESETVWRTVHGGGKAIKVGSTPSLVASPAIAERKTFYVWSTDDDVVKVTGPNVSLREVLSGVWRNVAAVVMDAGQTSAKFEIYGVREFKQTMLVMSAYPKYNVSDASGLLESDYASVPVACVEKLAVELVEVATNGLEAAGTTVKVQDANGQPLVAEAEGALGDKLLVATNSIVHVVYTATNGGFFLDGTTEVVQKLQMCGALNELGAMVSKPAEPKPPSVKLGVVAQRYPWDGFVDIRYKTPNASTKVGVAFYADGVLIGRAGGTAGDVATASFDFRTVGGGAFANRRMENVKITAKIEED